MAKKSVLGKGIKSLIKEEIIENDSLSTLININLIKANPNQPRKNFDETKLSELSESIKHHGILQPLILKKSNIYYNIVAGERRFRAAKLLGLETIPAIITNLSSKDLIEVSLIENIQREDLNIIEEAISYKALLNEFDITQDELSQRIGKSRASISNTIRLLSLNDDIKKYLINRALTTGHAKLILGIDDLELQSNLVEKIIKNNISVRETENLIKKLKENNQSKTKKTVPETNIYYKDISDRLQNYFGTKVNLNTKNNKGKIEIEYYSEEDLERILEMINFK